MVSSYTIRGMIVMTYPFVVMSALITKSMSKNDNKLSTSREEISALAGIGADEGVFSTKEYKIIRNLLLLKNVKAKDIMTPRVVAVVADEELCLYDFLKDKNYLKFSRIPVYSGDVENITGYIFRQTVFEKLAEDQHDLRLKDIKRDIVFIPYTMDLFDVWDKMLETQEHITLALDEYGGMSGIVTMEDIIETLLGLEIKDEKDTITDMQKFARDRWEKRQAKYNFLDHIRNEDQTI